VFPGQSPELQGGGGGGGHAASEPGAMSGAAAVDGAVAEAAPGAATADGAVADAAPGAATADGAPVTEGDAAAPAKPKRFRLPGAVVVWWIWVVFAAANLIDLAVDGRNHTGALIALTLVLITGLVYACALRPRVETDASGLTMHNPLRDHRVPWGAVTRVDLRESVQVHCAAETPGGKEKILYSWALFAPRRARYRSFRGSQSGYPRSRSPIGSRYGPSSTAPGYGKLPQEAKELQKQNTAQIMANELDGLARQARERGAAAGPRVVTWAWQPLAAIIIPALALALVAIAH
jgi:Bacterial PH domain